MLRAFFDGIAALVGWRVGEAVIRGAKREVNRTVRARDAQAKAAFLEELAACARQLPLGTPPSALVVVSSSQIEPHARKLECLACDDDGPMNIEQHRAETIDGISVRAIDLECRACGSPRTAYFRIERGN